MKESNAGGFGDQRPRNDPGREPGLPDPTMRSTTGAAPGTQPAGRRSGSKKLSRGLASLSAAAIIAVYGVGYLRTQDASAQATARLTPVASVIASPSTLPSTRPTLPALGLAASPTPTTAKPTQTAPASPTTQVAQASGYKDGTYVGTGSSRHGGIQAQVVIQNGKIVSASITRATTRYSTSVIRTLPNAVISTQSTDLHVISGATDSSNAYLDAVDAALAKAS
jgi:uncharacterized protein with FMN-binding domain